MAVVTRYFGSSSAGAADGTTWADRAAFVSAGAINTIISAFNFTSDSLIARVGPGTHTLTTAIQTFTGTTTPSITYPCILEAANSDGTRWIPPDPNWCSAQAPWSDTNMPVIATTTNISTLANAFVGLYGIKLTASGRNATMATPYLFLTWVQMINSASNTAASCFSIIASSRRTANVYAECSGTAYDCVAAKTASNWPEFADNIRLKGNISASSGNRRGFHHSASQLHCMSRLTVFGNIGGGYIANGASTGTVVILNRCVIADNTGDGIASSSTRTGAESTITNTMVTGGHTNGISVSTGKIVINNCRIRDYTTASITGNHAWCDPTNEDNVTTAGTDADEYVDQASGDYRIKNTSTYWGKGLGAGDQAAAGGVAIVNARRSTLIGR